MERIQFDTFVKSTEIISGFALLVRFEKDDSREGYPEGHIDAESYEKDIEYLKAKVEAGADVIITQPFYDTERFTKFVLDCRAIGIKVPIIPGIMPIHVYAGFQKMTAISKTFVPQEILDELEPIRVPSYHNLQ